MQEFLILSGNESAALAVIHSGVTSAYAYPGTPSTEIMTNLQKRMDKAFWCANEKTALEECLGTSFAGNRAFASMKHVGLNACADAFMSSTTLHINGGIVIVVADDPSMHSSQNEQDSRYYADFMRTICLEPSDIQETYDMIRNGFDLSEKFHKIVVVRMCTRLSHSKGKLVIDKEAAKYETKAVDDATKWNVAPAFSKRNWIEMVEDYSNILKLAEETSYNFVSNNTGEKAVITTGLAKQYFKELKMDLPHLHIGFYPFPQDKIAKFLKDKKEVYVIEEGYPFVERYLRGILPNELKIYGKTDKTFNPIGELTPETVAKGFGVKKKSETLSLEFKNLPVRPPQLCTGCPHRDTFTAIGELLKKYPDIILNSDIGCYSLGSLPPFSLPITLVDMGASITMAKGACDSGKKAIAIIGDSTFIHSGLQGLVDCVANSTPVTIVILDNSVTAMTGGQPQILPSQRLVEIAKAVGVEEEHVVTILPLPNNLEKNVEIIEKELNYNGVSVIIAKRECIEALRKAKKKVSV